MNLSYCGFGAAGSIWWTEGVSVADWSLLLCCELSHLLPLCLAAPQFSSHRSIFGTQTARLRDIRTILGGW